MMGLYIFSIITAVMLSLLVIILLVYRSMKLLERIADLLTRTDAQIRDRPGTKD